LFVYPLSRLELYRGFRHGQPDGGKIFVLTLVATIGLFILLVACINFMNMATASAEYRAREIGVRKVLGASRKKIVFQFLCEALLMTFIALVIGTILGILLLPLFNRLIHANIRFDFWNWRMWLTMIGTGLFTGLVAGSYPAVFLSRFKTAKVLKGTKSEGKNGGLLRKTLVTVQFMISIFFIVGTIVVYSEINHVRNRPIGYEQENLIDVHANGPMASSFDVFKNELSKLSGVKSLTAGSENLLEFGGAVTGMDWPGKTAGEEVSIIVSDVQYDWIKTSGVRLIEGRDFSPLFGTDSSACLVNESTVEKLRLKEPVIGKRLGGKEIIGVFQNFVFNNPSGIIAPMAVYLNTRELRHFLVRIQNDGHWRETLAQIELTSKKINPDFPFEFNFTKESYQQRFDEFNDYSFMTSLFGAITILISCLGLFGLSTFVAAKRSKEMSIRKVFGASVASIGLLLVKDFLKPIFIAFLIITPLTIWALQAWLADIPYHIELNWWMFALAGTVSILIAMLTVSYQGIRSALANPVDNLRDE
jgi:putative ABC transport system permease protein